MKSVADRQKITPEAKAYVETLYMALVSRFVGKEDELEKLGFPKAKARRTLTAEEKVLAAAKRKATREKLHTLGPRQKKALLKAGDGSVVVVKPTAANGADQAPKPGTAS